MMALCFCCPLPGGMGSGPVWRGLTCCDSVFGEPRSDITFKCLFQIESDVSIASLAFTCGDDWAE